MLSSEQLRAARALLRWDQSELAEKAAISIETIKRLEKMDGALSATRSSTLDSLVKAIQAAGVDLISENGGGVGVRLREKR